MELWVPKQEMGEVWEWLFQKPGSYVLTVKENTWRGCGLRARKQVTEHYMAVLRCYWGLERGVIQCTIVRAHGRGMGEVHG